ncbi:hypothetical protein D0O09_21040 [Pseudomonas putida]|mgnify:CR=1 FL=1|nr:hypothetical protein D0O09_21040 [Pseudomonas putida]
MPIAFRSSLTEPIFPSAHDTQIIEDLHMQIKTATTYRFVKSGNLVRTIEATSYGGRGNWVVARLDTGKEMVVAGKALTDQNHPDWS